MSVTPFQELGMVTVDSVARGAMQPRAWQYVGNRKRLGA
jgi:hypothetical protein